LLKQYIKRRYFKNNTKLKKAPLYKSTINIVVEK